MVQQQRNMRVPSELVPRCPVCGAPMTMNLRVDGSFVEDEGWHQASDRYQQFLQRNRGKHVLYLELGVGGNTPGIIKYPFWQMTYGNPKAVYFAIINFVLLSGKGTVSLVCSSTETTVAIHSSFSFPAGTKTLSPIFRDVSSIR